VVAVFAFHLGKSFIEITPVQISVNDLLQIGLPETVLPQEMLITGFFQKRRGGHGRQLVIDRVGERG
jgi:hypothetical protein